jgi:EAL domain-containing protein (putative c-di-GMP-specific phosphodiesterase class I)
MYQAKRKGGAGHQIIDLREAMKSSDRHSLETDLRAAFAGGLLDLAYQPVVRSADGSTIGVEALLRWTDPQRGNVPALSMIAVAEQVGLINQLGAWVLERSCRDRGQWLRDKPAAPLDLAVNVSPRQLMSPDFRRTVGRILTETEMDPAALILEITENVFIDDVERATTLLGELKDLGVKIALDDFGTGFSSLSYLRKLPIDIVKIDQSFIADIGEARTGGAIVAAVTNLAHVLGLHVTAEGVETAAQRDEVRAIGCEAAQGYFYARPMAATAVSAHLQSVA